MTMTPRHIFSIDVEEYFQVSAFEHVAPPSTWDQMPSRVEFGTRRILELLARHGSTATCFVVGWVAERHPQLVKEIVAAGHEVASHSYMHRRVTTLTPEQFREDLRRSRDVLEQVAGERVLGYRAPSFSIVPGVDWAWDILAEEGFTYDSSAFPIWRPGYGNPDAPRDPYVMETRSGTLHQVPLATASVGRWRLPAAGGAYLRVLPFGLVARALREAVARQAPAMCYIHPWEVDPDQPRLQVGAITRARHYTGLGTVAARLDRLFTLHRFTSVREWMATR
jgi:polysaccharide deacetylase family protein (PEP-CTERM system associated)